MDDLRSYDIDLYNNLMYLKYCDDSQMVEDMGLTFSMSEDYYGQVIQIPLVTNGDHIAVTK